MLRVRLDGLPPHAFVRTPLVHGILKYEPSSDAFETQQMFLTMFGSGKNVLKVKLPRRRHIPQQAETSIVPPIVEIGKETSAGLKRKRSAQVDILHEKPAATRNADRLAKLAAVTQGSALRRQGAEHVSLVKRLEKAAASKRKLSALGASDNRDRDFEKAVQKDDELREALRKLRETPAGMKTVPLATEGALLLYDADCDLSAVANISNLRCLRFENSLAQYKMLLTLPPRKLLWYVDRSVEESFILPRAEVAVKAFMLASRIFGGYVATKEWLTACEVRKTMVVPTLCLASMANQSLGRLG